MPRFIVNPVKVRAEARSPLLLAVSTSLSLSGRVPRRVADHIMLRVAVDLDRRRQDVRGSASPRATPLSGYLNASANCGCNLQVRFLRQQRVQHRFQLRLLLAPTLPGQDVDTFHLGNGYSYSLTVICNGCSDPHIDKNRIKPNKCVCHMRHHRFLPNWNPVRHSPAPLLDWQEAGGEAVAY